MASSLASLAMLALDFAIFSHDLAREVMFGRRESVKYYPEVRTNPASAPGNR